MARRLFEAHRFSNRFRYFQASIVNLRYSSSAAKISIDSREPGTTFLTDEELSITITGLRPKQNVTLRAISHSGGKHNTLFQSFAHYQADRDGLVDLKKHESIGGSYQGTEAMGLFWSMIPLKNDTVTVSKLADSNAHVPLKSELELYDGFIDLRFNSYSDALSFLNNISPMESKTIERWYYRKEKTRSETVKHGRIRGEIFIPNGPGEFQGVIDLFGSLGGLFTFRSALLASHGFASFALPFFGYDDLPNYGDRIDIEYFEEAIEWFLQHPQVKKDGVGIIAISFSVPLALYVASRMQEKVKGVICVNGSGSFIILPCYEDGKQIDYLPVNMDRVYSSADGHMITRNAFLFDEDNYLHPGARIPIEKITGKILYLASGDDQAMDAQDCARQMYEQLQRYGRGDLMETVVYPGAGHLLYPPYTPHCKHIYHRNYKLDLDFGGDAFQHSKAQELAWRKVLSFFRSM